MSPAPKLAKTKFWFILQNDRILVTKEGNKLTPLADSVVTELKPFLQRQHQLEEFEDSVAYCAEINADQRLPENIEIISTRKALELLGKDWYNLIAKAMAVINWDRNHQFCGRCGNHTIHKTGTFERVCNACSLVFYPRISPSVIVLIHHDDELIMARGHHFTPGAYGLIAGFVEPGESIEEAIHREVKEEVGLTIKNLRYFDSQAWPFPDSLMLAFLAEYATGELIVDKTELEEAGWYRFDNLPGVPSTNVSVARKLIDHFVAERKQKSLE